MSASRLARGGVAGLVVRWAARLRFPWLLGLTATLFLLDLFIPDVIPFADEIVLGLATAVLAALRKKPGAEDRDEDRDEKKA